MADATEVSGMTEEQAVAARDALKRQAKAIESAARQLTLTAEHCSPVLVLAVGSSLAPIVDRLASLLETTTNAIRVGEALGCDHRPPGWFQQ